MRIWQHLEPVTTWLKKNMILEKDLMCLEVNFFDKIEEKLQKKLILFSFSNLGSEDRAPAAMARAVTVHANSREVMYFA